jgi:hypothetical protein
VQRLPQHAVVTVLGVGDDGRQLQPRGATAAQQRQGEAPFLLKARRGWDAGGGPPRRIGRPRLGYVQQGAERPRSPSGPQRGGHRDLTIRDFAERPTVLPRHADGMRALFRKAGLVEDQDPSALGEHRAQATPHDVRVPRRIGDEVLQGLVGARLGHAGEHGRHRLARAVVQQALDIMPQRQGFRGDLEAVEFFTQGLLRLDEWHEKRAAADKTGTTAITDRYPAGVRIAGIYSPRIRT